MKNLFTNVIVKSLSGSNYIYSKYFQKRRFLDIGCGNGQLLAKFSNKGYGIDTNFQALTQAPKKSIKIFQASATNLPFKQNFFDSIYCNNLIEHLSPQEAYSMLSESARVLKPRGHLIMHTQTSRHNIWDTFSHIRPYPPTAIIKLTSATTNKEDYHLLDTLKPIAIYYEGKYFANRVLFFFTTLLAQFLPFLRHDYTMVLQKTG